jgi:hypothetical protein
MFFIGVIVGIYIGYKCNEPIGNAINNFNNWRKGENYV